MLKVSNNDIYAPDMSNHIHFNLLSMIYYDNTQGALHVNISDEPNNAISKKDDGLFVDTPNVLFKGYYATLADLQTSYPTPPNPNDYAGFYAYVNSTTENALYNNYI
jgi:hypothetical protein